MWSDPTEGFCWLASAVAGSWRWQGPAEREHAVETLMLVYVSQRRHASQLTPADRMALDAMLALGDLICETLTKAANKRITRAIHQWRVQYEDLPF